jgi:uncharacterized protein (TIGR03089 family)
VSHGNTGNLAGLLARLRISTSPRLVWYGPGGERVELSGRVLENWVAKTANLLEDTLDAGSGTQVELNLPTHWKSVVWALACWQAGAAPALPGATEAEIMVVADDAGTDAPAGGPGALILVALGALAMQWPGSLPPHAVDYAAEVRSHPDVYQGLSAGADKLILHTADGPSVVAARDTDLAEGTVALLGAEAPLGDALSWAMACWGSGGTLVLVHPEVPVTERLLQGERVTVRPAPERRALNGQPLPGGTARGPA